MRMGLLASYVIIASVLLGGVALADEPLVITMTLKDHAFTPAEVKVPKGVAFTLKVTNAEPVAAEIEAKKLHIEKVVVPGAEIAVQVKPQQPGKYLIVDEYHEDVAKAYVIAE